MGYDFISCIQLKYRHEIFITQRGHEANIRFIFGNSALSSTLFDVERGEFPAGCALANISLF